jgi:hypothetical protein
MAREFYDHQFTFPETRAFFENFARKKGVSLKDLRGRLERTQAGYFRQIFREAAQGEDYGLGYSERRLSVGMVHNVIDLPLKWYVGSYALYQDLVRKYLRRSFPLRPGLWSRAERAIFTVFNYDMQAVTEAFLNDLLQSFGVDLEAVQVTSESRDISDCYGEIKGYLRQALAESVGITERLWEVRGRGRVGVSETLGSGRRGCPGPTRTPQQEPAPLRPSPQNSKSGARGCAGAPSGPSQVWIDPNRSAYRRPGSSGTVGCPK